MCHRFGLILAFLALGSCASTPERVAGARVEIRPPGSVADQALSADLHLGAPIAAVPAVCAELVPADSFASSWDFYRRRYDADQDGRVTRAEYTRSDAAFARLDADRDGELAKADFARRWDAVPRLGPGESLGWGDGGPRQGELAPDFLLPATTGEALDLARFRGSKPVVLVFGSFT